MENVELTNMTMIINKENNQVLIQNRIKGSWTGIAFPGGHIEKGESIIDSAVREIKEETGLIVSNLEICGVKDWYLSEENKRYVVFLFKTYSYTGELIEHGEEGDVSWVHLNNILSLNLAHGFDKMLQVMMSKDINEYFIVENQDKIHWSHILK